MSWKKSVNWCSCMGSPLPSSLDRSWITRRCIVWIKSIMVRTLKKKTFRRLQIVIRFYSVILQKNYTPVYFFWVNSVNKALLQDYPCQKFGNHGRFIDVLDVCGCELIIYDECIHGLSWFIRCKIKKKWAVSVISD